MQKGFLVIAALGGLLAVVFGAFGAHSLREVLAVQQQTIWEKGGIIEYSFRPKFLKGL